MLLRALGLTEELTGDRGLVALACAESRGTEISLPMALQSVCAEGSATAANNGPHAARAISAIDISAVLASDMIVNSCSGEASTIKSDETKTSILDHWFRPKVPDALLDAIERDLKHRAGYRHSCDLAELAAPHQKLLACAVYTPGTIFKRVRMACTASVCPEIHCGTR